MSKKINTNFNLAETFQRFMIKVKVINLQNFYNHHPYKKYNIHILIFYSYIFLILKINCLYVLKKYIYNKKKGIVSFKEITDIFCIKG